MLTFSDAVFRRFRDKTRKALFKMLSPAEWEIRRHLEVWGFELTGKNVNNSFTVEFAQGTCA